MRIDLESGQGVVDFVIDLRTMEVVEYDGSREFHERFGGQTYYTSRSGVTHAGWIPSRPYVVHPRTYRIDCGWTYRASTHFEMQPGEIEWWVPFDYRGGNHGSWPVVAVTRDCIHMGGRLYAPPAEEEHKEDYSLEFFAPIPNFGLERRELNFEVRDEFRGQPVRRVLSKLYAGKMEWRNLVSHDWETLDEPSEFFTRLGLWYPTERYQPDDGSPPKLWKLIRGVIRGEYVHPDDCDSPAEALQDMAPPNTHVFDERFYVQRGHDGRVVAVGRHNAYGQEWAYEYALDTQDALRIFSDTDVQERVREAVMEGCRNKAEQQRETALRRQQDERLRQRFDEIIDRHGDTTLTIDDSVAVGNCEEGTREWRDRHFPGRESVTLTELKPFVREPAVWQVIRSKLARETSELEEVLT